MTRRNGFWSLAAIGAIGSALLVSNPPNAPAPDGLSGDSTTVIRVNDGPPVNAERRARSAPPPVWSISLPDLGIETLPTALAAGGGRVYVATATGAMIALDARSRHRVWSVAATASGLVHRLVMARDGELMVMSGPTDSVTVIASGTGSTLRRWMPSAFLQGGCSRSNGDMMLGSLDSVPLLTLDAAGVLRGRAPLPWPPFANAHALQRQLFMDGDTSGTCVVALVTGPGIAIYRDGRLARLTPYVERVTTPDVVVNVHTNGPGSRVVTARLASKDVAARDVRLMDGVVYVAFEGRGRLAGRIIDRFSAATGRYLGSLKFSTDVRRLAAGDACLYVAAYEHGTPMLSCYPTDSTAIGDRAGTGGDAR